MWSKRMKQQVENLIHLAIKKLQAKEILEKMPLVVQVDATKNKQHGDFASNIALLLAKAAKKNPKEMAALIVEALPSSPMVTKVEIAGPGFINFFLAPQAFLAVLPNIINQKEKFGLTTIGRQKKVLVEFVSSNPTGPLHVGHGRHAAFGAVLCNLLDAVGFQTHREYYVNDAGRQMDILTVSIWLRYLELCGEKFDFPQNGYRGDYIIDIARALQEKNGDIFYKNKDQIFNQLPLDENAGGDKEIYIDALIERTKKLLTAEEYQIIFDQGLHDILADIRDDLAEFGVEFDQWFSERKFVAGEVVDRLLAELTESGYVRKEDGALWFRSTAFGDEKDRVLVRSNGVRTYFANDVAYHLSKFERGYDLAIDIWGSDHHGYVKRMKAAIEASKIDPERLICLLGQFVTLYRGHAKVQMSTRGGNFVTLRELREEVGNDAARYFYVMRKYDHHIDFDLDLAKSKSNENPVYYVQYAHARICSVFKQCKEKNIKYDEQQGLLHLDLLIQEDELKILNTLTRYPDIIINAAIQYEPHLLTHYLKELATDFHAYYNNHQFLVEDSDLCNARLVLITGVKQILLNGFRILGISAPETM